MEFRTYRKVSLTEARVLTQEDANRWGGIIYTLEGPEGFQVGDYLGRDEKGEWPIKREHIERDYQRVSAFDINGFALYQPLDVRGACQMHHVFTVPSHNSIAGKPGDYLVQSRGMQWPVDREIFERAYVLVDLNQ